MMGISTNSATYANASTVYLVVIALAALLIALVLTGATDRLQQRLLP
jgi:hypothetical protein